MFAYSLNCPTSNVDYSGSYSSKTDVYGPDAVSKIGSIALDFCLDAVSIITDIGILAGSEMVTGGLGAVAIASTVQSSLVYNFMSLTNNFAQLYAATSYYLKYDGFSYTSVSMFNPIDTPLGQYTFAEKTIINGPYTPPVKYNPFSHGLKPINVHMEPIQINIAPIKINSINLDLSALDNLNLNSIFIT